MADIIDPYEESGTTVNIVDPFEAMGGEAPTPKISQVKKPKGGVIPKDMPAPSMMPMGEDIYAEGGRPSGTDMLGIVKEGTKLAGQTGALTYGARAGAAAGTAFPILGPATPAAGAVLGAGLAYAAEQLIERYGAYKTGTEGKKTAAFTEEAKQTAKDVLSGVAIQTVSAVPGAIIEKAFSPMAKAITDKITGEINAETANYIKTAGEAGYRPTAAEIVSGRSKSVALIEGMLSYLPGSASKIHRARMANLDKLVELRNDLIGRGAKDDLLEEVGYKIKKQSEEILDKTLKTRGAFQKEQLDATVNELKMNLDALHGASSRESGLADAIKEFYDVTGAATKPSSMGKSIQDTMGSVKTKMYKQSSDLLESASQRLKQDIVDTKISQPTADSLITEELASDYADPAVIRHLKPFATPEMPEEIQAWIKNPEMMKRNKEAIDALLEDIGESEKTWLTLDLDRQKLGELSRKANVLQGTPYAGTRGSTTKAGRAYSMLREAIEDDMATYAESAAPEDFANFIEGRRQWREAKELFDDDALGIMKASPEDVFGKVIKPGEVEMVQKLKKILGKDFDPFKEMFTRQIVAFEDGVFDVAKTKANIVKYGETVEEVLGADGKRELMSAVSKGSKVEADYARSQALKDLISVDSKGTINVEATRKKLLTQKDKISEHFTEDQINDIERMITQTGNINLRSIARNKQEAMEFLTKITRKKNDEEIVKAIVRPHNTVNINYMKKILGPERTEEVATEFIKQYLMKINKQGYYEPGTAAGIFNNYDKTMKALLGPERYAETSKLMEINKKAAILDQLASNPSKTAQGLIAFETGKELLRSATYFALAGAGGYYASREGHTGAGMIYALALATLPYGLAKVYLSDTGRKLLSIGYKIPASSQAGIELITKMSILAGVNFGRHMKTPKDVGKAVQDGAITKEQGVRALQEVHGME
jgi:hypothetical protein